MKWKPEFDMPEVFNDVGRYVDYYNRALHKAGLEARIDEVAYLFKVPAVAAEFVHQAVQEQGCALFNASDDVVDTGPLRSSYSVRYQFLTVPPMYVPASAGSVRIEAMQITEGHSPLHHLEASTIDRGTGRAVHASFKCETEEAYAEAGRQLKKNEWESVQRCTSSYGRFSYWLPLIPEELDFQLYLKPRVNLRSAS